MDNINPEDHIPTGEDARPDAPVVEQVPEHIPNFNTELVYSRELPEKFDKDEESVNLPPDRQDKIQATIKKLPNINLVDTPEGRAWVKTIEESMRLLPIKEIFAAAVDRENAEWENGIKHEGRPLEANEPNFGSNTGKSVSGERALMRVRSLLNKGSILRIPLWHSGFWITIKAPADTELMELFRRIGEDKIDLGRHTYGLIYGNNSVFIAQWVIDFVIAHIYDVSVELEDGKDLKDLILVSDLQQLIWGLALSIWRKGFQYSRPCIDHPEKCNHVTREMINLAKLSFVNRPDLSVEQRSHMTNMGGSTMKLDKVMSYRASFTRGVNRRADLNEDIQIDLRTPTLNEYIVSGSRWVNGIVSMIDDSLTSEVDEKTRNVYISRIAATTAMRQYSHWIKAIVVQGDVIEESEIIEKLLDDMSSEADIRKNYLFEVKKYIEDVTVSIIAIPNYKCPICNKEAGEENKKFPRLVPIDALVTFFTLLVPKCIRMTHREL